MAQTLPAAPLPDEVRVRFLAVLADAAQLPAFEQWVYASRELEAALDPNDYVDLLALDYRRRDAAYEARKILKKYVSAAEVETHRLKHILEEIIAGGEGAYAAIRETYELYCHGYSFLDGLGLGYGLGLVADDDYGASPPGKARVARMYPEVAAEAERVLGWLVSGKVALTGKLDVWFEERCFVDHRRERDKKDA